MCCRSFFLGCASAHLPRLPACGVAAGFSAGAPSAARPITAAELRRYAMSRPQRVRHQHTQDDSARSRSCSFCVSSTCVVSLSGNSTSFVSTYSMLRYGAADPAEGDRRLILSCQRHSFFHTSRGSAGLETSHKHMKRPSPTATWLLPCQRARGARHGPRSVLCRSPDEASTTATAWSVVVAFSCV